MNHHLTLMLFSLFLFMFFFDVKAQTPQYSQAPSNDVVSNFEPSLAVVIGILSIMFALTFILLLYAKFCHRPVSVHTMSLQIHDGLARSRSTVSGIDKTVIESLPMFRFSSLKGSREGLECVVCLSKFEDVEILRLLPKCKHAFHIDCVDQWLEKHSTCPLCRQRVSSDDVENLPYSDSVRFLWKNSEIGEESNLELYVEREEDFTKSDKGDQEEELPIKESLEDKKSVHKFNHKIIVSDFVLKNRWSNVSSSDLMFLNSEMLSDLSSRRFSSLDSRTEQKSSEIREESKMMNIKEEMERKRSFESKLSKIKKNESIPFPSGFPSNSGSRKDQQFGSSCLDSNEKRSMSEIIVHPRFTEFSTRGGNRDSSVPQNNIKEERVRRLWLPIARKTVQWFANRERRSSPPESQGTRSALHV